MVKIDVENTTYKVACDVRRNVLNLRIKNTKSLQNRTKLNDIKTERNKLSFGSVL